MKKYLVFLVLIILLSFPYLKGTAQQSSPPWRMHGCFSLDEVTNFLNNLPPGRATEAKVIAINSQRSFLGSLSTPYYVWYRR